MCRPVQVSCYTSQHRRSRPRAGFGYLQNAEALLACIKHEHEQEVTLMQQQLAEKDAAMQELKDGRDDMLAAAQDASHMCVLQAAELP